MTSSLPSSTPQPLITNSPPLASVTNICENGSTASNTTGYAILNAATLTRVSTPGRNGFSSLQVTTGGLSGSGVSYTTPSVTNPAGDYICSFWIYTTGPAVNQQISFNLQNATTTTGITNAMTLTGGWQRIVQSCISDGTSALKVKIWDPVGVAFTFNITMLMIEAGHVPHDYVPTVSGQVTKTFSEDTVWNGKMMFNHGFYPSSDPAANNLGGWGASYVTSPVRRSGNSLRLHNEATVYDSGFTNRIHNDLVNRDFIVREGDEYWIGFSLFFGNDFTYIGDEASGSGHWSTYADLPHASTSYGPYTTGVPGNGVVLNLDCSTTPISIRLRCYGGDDTTFNNNDPNNASVEVFYMCDFVRNKWIDFLFHMNYTWTGALGNSTGFIEAWVNGQYWKYGKHHRPLLFKSNPTGVIHLAYYHSQLPAGYASTMYHDEWRIGKSAKGAMIPGTTLGVTSDILDPNTEFVDSVVQSRLAAASVTPANIISGTLAARPDPTTVPNQTWYIATDDKNGSLYIGNGATWTEGLPGPTPKNVFKYFSSSACQPNALEAMMVEFDVSGPFNPTTVTFTFNGSVDHTKVFDIGIYDSTGAAVWRLGGGVGVTAIPAATGDQTITVSLGSPLRRGSYYFVYGDNDGVTTKVTGIQTFPIAGTASAVRRQIGGMDATVGLAASLASSTASSRALNFSLG